MTTSVKTPIFDAFRTHSIDPLVKESKKYNRLDDAGKLLRCQEKIDEAILTVASLLPNEEQETAKAKIEEIKSDIEMRVQRILSNQTQRPKVAHVQGLRPILPGIPNQGNTCFLAVVINMLMGNERLQHALPKEIVSEHRAAQREDRTTRFPNLRVALAPNSRAREQGDAQEVLNERLAKIGFEYDLWRINHSTSHQIKENKSMIQVNITPESKNLTNMVESTLDYLTEDHQHIEFRFQQAPNDLLIHAARFKNTSQKIDDPIDAKEVFTLPAKRILGGKEDAPYQIRGCIIHLGTLNDGHYIYLRRTDDNRWELGNDSMTYHWNAQTQKWDAPEPLPSPEELLKQGYIYHYEKVEISEPAQSAPALPAQTQPVEVPIAVTPAPQPAAASALAKRDIQPLAQGSIVYRMTMGIFIMLAALFNMLGRPFSGYGTVKKKTD